MGSTSPGLRSVKLYAVSSNADFGGSSDFSSSVAPGLLQSREDETMRVQLLSFDCRYTFPVIQAGYNNSFVVRSQNVPTIVSGVNDKFIVSIGTTDYTVTLPAGDITDHEIITAFNSQMSSRGVTLSISYAGAGNWQFSSGATFYVNWNQLQPNTRDRFGFKSGGYFAQQPGGTGSFVVQNSQDPQPYSVYYSIYSIPTGAPNLDAIVTSLNSQLPGITVKDNDGTFAATDSLRFTNTNSKQDIFFDFSAPRLKVSCAKTLGFFRGRSYALGNVLDSPAAANVTGPDNFILSLAQNNNGLPGSSISNFGSSTQFTSTPNVLAIIPINVSYNEKISFTPHSEDPGLRLVDRQINSLSLSIRDPLGFQLNLDSLIYSVCLLFTFDRGT